MTRHLSGDQQQVHHGSQVENYCVINVRLQATLELFSPALYDAGFSATVRDTLTAQPSFQSTRPQAEPQGLLQFPMEVAAVSEPSTQCGTHYWDPHG